MDSALINSLNGNVSVTVGGSVIAGTGDQSASILCKTTMGAIKIGGNLKGDNGSSSALIGSTAGLSSVAISGAVIGGKGDFSGGLTTQGNIGQVSIGSKANPAGITGGAGTQSGLIFAAGSIAKVTLAGSLIGGTAAYAGAIVANAGVLQSLTIAGSVTAGSTVGAGGAYGGSVGSVVIGGDLVGGYLASVIGAISSIIINGSIIPSLASARASITAATVLSSLTVKGNARGSENGTSSSPVIISAGGNGGGGKTDIAIKAISISGDVELVNVLAGYNLNSVPTDRHAQIGTVLVGGNWIASNIVAGAVNTPSSNASFGDANDVSIPAASPSDTSTALSSIASIKIAGTVAGTPAIDNAGDHFGFVAQQITAVSIGGDKVVLTAGCFQ